MTSAIQSIGGRPPRFRWSGEEFDLASETGVFGSKRVELINGELLEIPPMNDPHAQAVRLADYALRPIFPPSVATISIQCPMRLGESRPFPDLVVVGGTPRQITKHPTTALLIIEVSDTTLEFDQTEKALLYARHGLPDYWIINLNERCVEVRRAPARSRGAAHRYKTLKIFGQKESVSSLAAPEGLIKVSDLLP